MPPKQEIVITGLGVVSPIGIGVDPFWAALREGRSGIRTVALPDQPDVAAPIGGAVADFDPKQYVRPRKSLKVMSRDIQLGFAAADLACVDAGLRRQPIDPERLGVVFGAGMISCELDELAGTFRGCLVGGAFDFRRWGTAAMTELFPLWMLKYLPNMPACHIGIGQDARGPNNSITLGDVSSLSALAEAAADRRARPGRRDHRRRGRRTGPSRPMGAKPGPRLVAVPRPRAPPRPFDLDRDGRVNGEGAAAFTVETRATAEARGARAVGPDPRLWRGLCSAQVRPAAAGGHWPGNRRRPGRRGAPARGHRLRCRSRLRRRRGRPRRSRGDPRRARRRAGHRAEELLRPSRRRRRRWRRPWASFRFGTGWCLPRCTTSSPTRNVRSMSSTASQPRCRVAPS